MAVVIKSNHEMGIWRNEHEQNSEYVQSISVIIDKKNNKNVNRVILPDSNTMIMFNETILQNQ